MRNFNPKDKPRTKEFGERNGDGLHREDSDRREGSYASFTKDKRTRTGVKRVERISRDTRPDYPRHDREEGERPRRSFNPNFTKDNRLKDNGKPYPKEDGNARTTRKPYEEKDWKGKPAREHFRRDEGAGHGWRDRNDPERTGKPYGDRKKSGEWKKRTGGKRFDKPKKDGDYPRFAAPKQDKPIRLNRFLAMSGLCSRREADDYITAGVVTVNGVVVTELGSKVSPDDEVRFNDSIVRGEKKVYILMNKPKGFVTTLDDPHADKTVMDLVKGACTERVYPVGRLDKNSVGVLLITNDGDLTKRLTHPSYSKQKIYQVSLDKPLTKADMEQIAQGVELEDGPIFADEISYVKDNHKEIGIEIHSGRNRIVRRIFEYFGYKVQKLDRVYFAGLTKKSLKRGAWRFLTPREVAMLKSGEYE